MMTAALMAVFGWLFALCACVTAGYWADKCKRQRRAHLVLVDLLTGKLADKVSDMANQEAVLEDKEAEIIRLRRLAIKDKDKIDRRHEQLENMRMLLEPKE